MTQPASATERVLPRGLPAPPSDELEPYLDAATCCVERYGWSRTSTKDIAREAGVERTTLYRHLGSKDRILRLLIAREAHRLIDAAIAMGADDAWVLPVTMKKSRPGHQVRVLCSPPLVPEVRGLLARETGTLGWREWSVTKHELPRHETVVELDGRPVRIKVGPHGAKPEHDDVVGIARASGRAARDVAAEAAAAFRDTLP